MYELKEVLLKNGEHEERRLVIEFHDEELAILAEFLMSDSQLLSDELTLAFDHVRGGFSLEEELSGNRCSVVIGEYNTEISDLFDDLDSDVTGYQALELPTEEFHEYVDMWQENLAYFNDENVL